MTPYYEKCIWGLRQLAYFPHGTKYLGWAMQQFAPRYFMTFLFLTVHKLFLWAIIYLLFKHSGVIFSLRNEERTSLSSMAIGEGYHLRKHFPLALDSHACCYYIDYIVMLGYENWELVRLTSLGETPRVNMVLLFSKTNSCSWYLFCQLDKDALSILLASVSAPHVSLDNLPIVGFWNYILHCHYY